MVLKVSHRKLIHSEICIHAVSRKCDRNYGAAGMIELLGKKIYPGHVCAESYLTMQQADKYLG